MTVVYHLRKWFLVLLSLFGLCSCRGETPEPFFPPPEYETTVQYGGYYKSTSIHVLLLAVEPKFAKRAGFDPEAHNCDLYVSYPNNPCNHLSGIFTPQFPAFSKLPKEVREAALAFQTSPPGSDIPEETDFFVQLTRYPLTYLEALCAELNREWAENKDDPESVWSAVVCVDLYQSKNLIQILLDEELVAGDTDLQKEETAAARFQTLGIDSDAIAYGVAGVGIDL